MSRALPGDPSWVDETVDERRPLTASAEATAEKVPGALSPAAERVRCTLRIASALAALGLAVGHGSTLVLLFRQLPIHAIVMRAYSVLFCLGVVAIEAGLTVAVDAFAGFRDSWLLKGLVYACACAPPPPPPPPPARSSPSETREREQRPSSTSTPSPSRDECLFTPDGALRRARARADSGFGSWAELGTWERVTNIASMSMIVIGALWVLNAPLSLCLNRTGCCACCAPCCCIHEAKRGERDPLTGLTDV